MKRPPFLLRLLLRLRVAILRLPAARWLRRRLPLDVRYSVDRHRHNDCWELCDDGFSSFRRARAGLRRRVREHRRDARFDQWRIGREIVFTRYFAPTRGHGAQTCTPR